jgi:hypothetical protein
MASILLSTLDDTLIDTLIDDIETLDVTKVYK